MMRKLLGSIKGAISLFLLTFSTLFFATMILLFFGLSYLAPTRRWRYAINRHFVQKMPVWYMLSCKGILWVSTRNKWDVQGQDNLKHNGWYIMISNHQSWIDILVLGTVFNYVIPSLKFFMKKELLWQLPVAGLATYAIGYPFVARHSHADIRKNPKLKGKDIQTTLKACEQLKRYPATLINFIEGTRFSRKKYLKQKPPYKHLLKPRAGGLSIALQALHDKLDGIVNVAILYPGKQPTLWQFLSGNFQKVVVRYELVPVTPEIIGNYQNDRQFRATFQQWLNTIWQGNDEKLDQLIKQYEK